MRCTIRVCHLTLPCLLVPAIMLTVADIAPAADAPKPAVAGAVSKAPARLKPETPAQANARHAQRSKLDIPKGAAVAAPADSGSVTIESLGTMLDTMGYEPKAGTYSSGTKYFVVTIVRDTTTVGITFEVSGDKSEIWLSAFFGNVDDPDKVKPAPLFKLLEANNDVWPSYFDYVTDSKSLYLYRPLRNSDIKPALLRNTIEAFITNVQSTSSLWDMSTWTATPAPAAPAAR